MTPAQEKKLRLVVPEMHAIDRDLMVEALDAVAALRKESAKNDQDADYWWHKFKETEIELIVSMGMTNSAAAALEESKKEYDILDMDREDNLRKKRVGASATKKIIAELRDSLADSQEVKALLEQVWRDPVCQRDDEWKAEMKKVFGEA